MMAHYHYEVVYGTRDGKRHLIGGELTPPPGRVLWFSEVKKLIQQSTRNELPARLRRTAVEVDFYCLPVGF